MKYFNKIFIFLLLSGLFLMVCASVSAVDINYQNNISDSVVLSENSVSGLVLANANDDVKVFNAGDYGDINWHIKEHGNNMVINLISDSYSGSYPITVSSGKNVTINGHGHTIYGNNGNFRFLNIESGSTVVLNDIIFKNFKTEKYDKYNKVTLKGGCIYNSGDLILNGCWFENNGLVAGEEAYGGAIYNTGTLRINTTTFVSNFVYSYTAGAASNHAYGGAIYNDAGNVYIDNSVFKSNRANDDDKKGREHSYGGAVCNSKNGNLVISNSKFIGNEVDSKAQIATVINYGGAVCNFGVLKISDCEFRDNNAWSYSVSGLCKAFGGAIYNGVKAVATIEGKCVFIGNRAHTGDRHNYGYGGAICNDEGNMSIKSLIQMIGNEAGNGNSFYACYNSINFNGRSSSSLDSDVDMVSNPEVKVFNASNYGDINLHIQDEFNMVINLVNNNYDASYTINVGSNKRVTINGNGAVINGNGNKFLSIGFGSTVVLNNLTIKNCKSGSFNGGAISNNGELVINGCVFDSNGVDSDKSAYGGAIYNSGILRINNTRFVNNYVYSYVGGAVLNYGRGGAIYNDNGDVFIDNCVFESNRANDDDKTGRQYSSGGAIYNYGKIGSINGNLIISNSKFYNNIVESKCTSSTVDNYGGAICNDGVLKVTDCEFVGNNVWSMSNTGFCHSYGGAISNSRYGSAIIEGYCIFVDNVASTGDSNNDCLGGAIFNEGKLSINSDSLKLIDNKAKLGKSFYSISGTYIGLNNCSYNSLDSDINMVSSNDLKVFNASDYGDINWHIKLEVNVLINLVSDAYYGSYYIFVDSGKNVTINGNGHTIYGKDGVGFLHVSSGSTVVLNNVIIKDFKTEKYELTSKVTLKGGCIYNSGDLVLNDCCFENNGFIGGEEAFGGAIYNTGTLRINNTSFVSNFVYSYTKTTTNNYARGGAIYNDNGNVYIDNSVFKGNRANDDDKTGRQYSEGGAIYNHAKMKEMNVRNGNLVISNSKFIGNEVDSKCQSCTVINHGGAICNDGLLMVSDCEFRDNNAWSYSFSGTCKAFGGAIYNSKDSVANIEGSCIFTGNRAHTGDSHNYGYGGAVSNEGKMSFKSDTLVMSGNEANEGKSLYTCDPVAFNYCSCTSLVYDINMIANGTIAVDVKCKDDVLNLVKAGGFKYYIFNLMNDVEFSESIVVVPGMNVTINGNGYKVSTSGNNIFLTNNGVVVLNNLSVVGFSHRGYGVVDLRGGAISNNGIMTINNCVFKDNYVDSGKYGYGGCIYNIGNLVICNSTFDSNYVFTYNAQAENYAYGGAIASVKGSVEIYNCTFNNNNLNKNHRATFYNYGGAIYNSANLLISGSVFDGNFIYNYDGVQNQIIGSKGGCIYNDAMMYVLNCDFLNNYIQIDETKNNRGYCLGGCIYTSSNGNTNILGNCSFVKNYVKTYKDISLEKKYFYGGAICNDGETNIMGIIKMNDNYCQNGANIYSFNPNLIINNLKYNFLDGNFVIGNISNCSKVYSINDINDVVKFINGNENNLVFNLTKGEYLLTGTINVIPGQIITINGNGSVVDCDNMRFMDLQGSTVYLNDLTIKHVKVTDYSWLVWEKTTVKGGCIINNGELFIDGCVFDNCGIDSGEFAYGGVICNYGNLNLNNTVFNNNFARSHTTSANKNYAYGGVIYNDGGYVDINNCLFKDNNVNKDQNHAQFSYGGVISNKGEMYITNSVFINNMVESHVSNYDSFVYGGVIYNENFISIINCNFTDNSAKAYSKIQTCKAYGGAIYTSKDGKTVIMGNCSFTGNKACTGDKHNYGYGGAICNEGITMIECDSIVMSDNTAKYGANLYGLNVERSEGNFMDANILLNGIAYKELNDNVNIVDSGIAKFNYENIAFIRIVDFTYVNGTTISGNEFMNILFKESGYNFTTFNNLIKDLMLKMNITTNMSEADLNASLNKMSKVISDLINSKFNETNVKSYSYLVYSSEEVIFTHYHVINSADELMKFARDYNSNPNQWNYLNLILNGTEFLVDGSVFKFDKSLKVVEITGNNTLIKVNNPDEKAEYHFIVVDKEQFVLCDGLVLSGFNTAVRNEGVFFGVDCVFDNNRMDYGFEEDYGGAIKNFGSLFCVNCTFSNNKAALGGAIYNKNAICHIENCTFVNNNGYRHGDDIYNFDKVALTVNMTDCELYYDKPLPDWAQTLITFGVGVAVTIVTAVVSAFIPPAATWYVGALYGAIVGAVSGAATSAISSFIIACTNHIENRGKYIGVRVGISAGIGAAIGFIIGGISTKIRLSQEAAAKKAAEEAAKPISLEDIQTFQKNNQFKKFDFDNIEGARYKLPEDLLNKYQIKNAYEGMRPIGDIKLDTDMSVFKIVNDGTDLLNPADSELIIKMAKDLKLIPTNFNPTSIKGYVMFDGDFSLLASGSRIGVSYQIFFEKKVVAEIMLFGIWS